MGPTAGGEPREMNWIWTIGAPLVRVLFGWFFRLRIEGIEHVPRRGQVIVAPNHVSVLDGPLMVATVGTHRWRATRCLIAAEIFTGLTGWILRQARQIPIRRGSGDTGALDEAVEAILDGACAGVFPEGRVSDDADAGLQRIRSGLTRVAVPTGAPVVPVGIWGTQRVWAKAGVDRAALLRRPRLAIVFGPPIMPAGSTPTEFRERYRVALEAQLARAQHLARDDA
ncbi:MAG: lysophospholipid acyltransferase family protein [Actinomycetota bacterium]